MSASEPPGDPDAWDPDATSAVPVGPEPEATGAGGAGGAGGWGAAARVEPFAIAALVWAIVSIVVPVLGTIVAFVLAAKAADLIRRSRGERTGMQYVTAARIVAGVVLALWIIGGIAFLALRDDDDSSNSNVAVPTQPPTSTIAPPTTSTTLPLTTTTTKPPVTTTASPPPTITVIPPPPTEAPTTTPPTAPPTTAPPLTTATTPPTSATKPPVTTTPQQAAAKVQEKLLTRPQLGPSNRGIPDDERFVVSYTPGQDLLVTWAINNGDTGDPPTGTPTCATPPTDPPATTSSTTSSTTSPEPTSPTSAPSNTSKRTTQEQARFEAKQMLQSIKPQITSLKLDITGVQLVGTYPIEAAGEDDVVQVLYSKTTVQGSLPAYKKMFDQPPAEAVQCLNPAFELN